jgi:hypothetical protein
VATAAALAAATPVAAAPASITAAVAATAVTATVPTAATAAAVATAAAIAAAIPTLALREGFRRPKVERVEREAQRLQAESQAKGQCGNEKDRAER